MTALHLIARIRINEQCAGLNRRFDSADWEIVIERSGIERIRRRTKADRILVGGVGCQICHYRDSQGKKVNTNAFWSLKFWNDDLNHPECELRLLIGDVGKALSPHHGWRKGKRRCPLCARYFECPQQFKTKSKFQSTQKNPQSCLRACWKCSQDNASQ